MKKEQRQLLGTLVFDLDDTLKSIIAHAKSCKWFGVPYTQRKTKKSSLLLVKDRGIYLMSNGLDTEHKKPDGKGFVVAYARTFNPDNLSKRAFMDMHQRQREVVGGDDFAVAVPLETFLMVVKGKRIIEMQSFDDGNMRFV